MVDARSRSERRSEKKQSFVFIAFLVTVAVVCFASGFMVGRNTASTQVEPQVAAGTANQPIANQPVDAKPAEEKEAEKLTFYDALPKGDQAPMGSGINLPPQEKPEPAVVQQVAVAPEKVAPAIPDKVFEPVKEEPVVKKETVAKPSTGADTDKYILQVASFPQPDEAGKLLGKLTQGGYDVYVQQADLGSKGIWYRVYVGPITGKSKATTLLTKIERDFKVKPILRTP